MKKNYTNPEIELVVLANEDVLTTSTTLTSKSWTDFGLEV